MAQDHSPDLTPSTTKPQSSDSDIHRASESPQQQTSPAVPSVPGPAVDTGYTESGVPTLEGVRDKIETRYGRALGAIELAEETNEVRAAGQQYEARQKAAAEKLNEIRASMNEKD